MAKPASMPVTPEEYLRQERARTDGRAELLDGEIVMMAGATRRHNRIVSSIDVALNVRLAGGRCEAIVTDMKVKAQATESYTYPNVVVFCDDTAEFEDEKEDVLTTPLVIFEVLSPSTRGRDRGDKFAYYRTIPSLRHYVLVDTQGREVDHYARQGDETWLFTTLRGQDVLRLDPPGVELPLDEIYRRAGL
jgi:Uma2 family endonuclease